jgi:hypothetical protein
VQAAVASLGSGGGGINPSLLVNGDFQINQRAFAGGALAAGAYGRDRWKADTGGANYSVAGAVVTLTSGTLVQVVETVFWGYTSLAATQVTVSVDTPSADLTVTVGSSSGTITAGSGRRSVTVTTGAGDTGNLAVKIAKASAGSVTFSRVKVEVGATATAWQARNAQEELRLCQRYFYRWSGAPSAPVGFGSVWSATSALFAHRHPVTMRAAPSLALTGTAISLAISSPGFYQNPSALGLYGVTSNTPELCMLDATIVGAAAVEGRGAMLSATSTPCHLDFSAEL